MWVNLSNLHSIMTRYEGIKPRAKERSGNVTELILELEQRCTIRYVDHLAAKHS